MIIVRTVMQAAFGRGGELAAEFVRAAGPMQEQLGSRGRWRVMTDLSGPFDTVIQEVEVESLAAWEQERARLFGLPAFRESMGRMQGMIVSGRNEYWTVEGEG